MAGKKLHWRKEPEAKDFAAATAYLSLILPEREAKALVARLKRAGNVEQAPKNIERASGLKLLPADDPEVADKLKKLKKGQPLSPILLVRGRMSAGMPLIVADGYHRVCASYIVDQEAQIPCRLVDNP
ncbi:MAG: hypothetical protein M3082_15090 [Candidatus Dormibacteraeota bacterium]|nr:hypothetical protein [Candidatus Dormibacteraeota bacterium]